MSQTVLGHCVTLSVVLFGSMWCMHLGVCTASLFWSLRDKYLMKCTQSDLRSVWVMLTTENWS